MPSGVNMSAPGLDDSRMALPNAAGHGFYPHACRLAGWPSFRPRLDATIDLKHPPTVLSTRLPCGGIEAAVAPKLTRQALHALSGAAGCKIRWLLRAIARLGLGALFCALTAVAMDVASRL